MPPARNAQSISISCSTCGKDFIHKSTLRRHMRGVHRRPLLCTCGYTTKRKDGFVRHLKGAHGYDGDDAARIYHLANASTSFNIDPYQEKFSAQGLPTQISLTQGQSQNSDDIFHTKEQNSILPTNTHSNPSILPEISQIPENHKQWKDEIDLKRQTYNAQETEYREMSKRCSNEHSIKKDAMDISFGEQNSQSAQAGRSKPDIPNREPFDKASGEQILNRDRDHHETSWTVQSNRTKGDISLGTMDRVKLNQNQQEQGVHATQSEIPFTDSGYNSAPTLNYGSHKWPVSPCSLLRTSSLETYHDEDAGTCFSMESTVNPRHDQDLITQLSNEISHKLRQTVAIERRSILSTILPELVKAFAIKICHDTPAKMNRDIMYFLYKRHRTIAAQIEETLYSEKDDEWDYGRDRTGDMSFLDKMDLWNSKADQDSSITPEKHDLFEGVKDEDSSIDQSDISTYHKIIVDSAAYMWFLMSIKTESVQQLETPQPRIRQTILDKLPTGKISKRRSPNVYEVTFDLRKRHGLLGDFKLELFEMFNRQDFSTHNSIITIGSGEDAQGCRIEQYLTQTWPTNGLQLLDTLQKALTNAEKYFEINLPGNTQLEVKISSSHLVVTATGPAYFVAECGETLAWIGSVLLSNTQNSMGYCAPSITGFSIQSIHSHSPVIKYKGNCNIELEITQPETLDDSLSGTESLIQQLFGERIHILGFPIHRRPEGYPGLELSFNTLLHSLQAEKVDTIGRQTVMKGLKSTMNLAKHADNVFLWHLVHPPTNECLCSIDQNDRVDDSKTYMSSGYHVMETGRHIVMNCTGVPSNSEATTDVHSSAKRPSFVEGDAIQSDLWTENSLKLLSTASDSGSLSVSSGDLSDSAMVSISKGSDLIEPLDSKEEMHTVLSNVLDRLILGFRRATQYQASPGESRGHLNESTSATQSSDTGKSSSNSRKRNLERKNDKGDDEDGSTFPLQKKRQTKRLKMLERSFACPFWKRNSSKHSGCYTLELRRIRDVKQHLTRIHVSLFRCPICQKNFPDDQSLRMHVKIGKCSFQDPAMLDGISFHQHLQLSRKSNSKISQEDQWFAIWDILFPGCQKPSSVYIDTDLSPEMRLVYEYYQNHAPRRVREDMDSDPNWLRPEVTEEQRQLHVDRMTSLFLRLITDWPSNRRLSSISLERNSNIPQPLQHETPSSSNADSGVAVGSQSSSREIGFQGTSEIPALELLEREPAAHSGVVDYQQTNPSLLQAVVMPPPLISPQSFPPAFPDFLAEGLDRNWDCVDFGFQDTFHTEPSRDSASEEFGDIMD